MKIKISGSSGYLGGIISTELQNNGHQVEGISRNLLYGPEEQLANELKNSDVVIHLAGAPILKRWTTKNKKAILDSRFVTGKNLAHAINLLDTSSRPKKVISASGISIYQAGKIHTESSFDYDRSFLGEVIKNWEQPWRDLTPDVELTTFRMAVVLGKESPTIKTMRLPFKLGVGGKIGNGNQPFPFVHEKDVARAFNWALENSSTNGLYLLAAPHQVNNAEFTRELAKAMKRPAFMRVPAFALKLLYGEASAMIINSPAVHPEKLLKKGFQFKYPTIEQTLDEIFNS